METRSRSGGKENHEQMEEDKRWRWQRRWDRVILGQVLTPRSSRQNVVRSSRGSPAIPGMSCSSVDVRKIADLISFPLNLQLHDRNVYDNQFTARLVTRNRCPITRSQHILRLLNTNVKGGGKIGIALTEIKGVGRRYANLVCKKADVDLNKR